MINRLLPRANAAIVSSSGTASIEFRNFLQSLIDSGQFTDQQAEIEAILVRLQALENADEIDAQVYGILSVLSIGSLQDGAVALQLVNDEQEPGNTYYYGTGQDGTKGWFTVASALAVEPRLTIAVGLDGIVTFDLAELPNTGVGTAPVKTYTRDAWGRIEGDQDATTDDLPEGAANLYFTEERAQDAVGAIVGDTADIDLTYDDAGPSITGVLTPAVHASLALADSAVQSVVAGTNVTVDATDPQNPIVSASGGGGAAWGSITGTLSAQTDLQAALDAKQPLDADLTAIAGASPAANQGIYWTGAGAVSTYGLTAGGRALAGVAGTANTAPYFSASNTVTLQAVSASGRNLWNIGGTIDSVAYLSAANTWSLTAISASGRNLLTSLGTAGNIAYLSAANTWSLWPITAFGRSLIDDANAADGRDTLGVAFRGALVNLTAVESIPDNTNTAVPFDAESYDIGGWWTAGSPTRLTVPSGVTFVRVTAGVFFNTNATGQRLMRLFKNGTAVTGGFSERQDACSALSSDMAAVSAVLQVTAGDYFEMIVNQNSGAALNLLDAGTGTWMCIEALAD